ncbi:prefoldin subunit beta [Candidatus Woesearchaeota archaeon]|nr:prefoldin subunit beta [Candidatus Woesearchaeota archaeon]
MTQADFNQLQLLQQNLQNTLLQKQQFQKQSMEIDSALEELKDSSAAYKIIGNIMVASKKPDLQKDLQQKKELIDLRLKNFEKQEQMLKEKAEELQKKVMEQLKEKK